MRGTTSWRRPEKRILPCPPDPVEKAPIVESNPYKKPAFKGRSMMGTAKDNRRTLLFPGNNRVGKRCPAFRRQYNHN